MATVTINTLPKDQWLSFTINHSALQQVGVTIKTTTNTPYSIDWGDGTIDNDIPSNSTAIHTFSKTVTILKIKATNGLYDIINFNSTSLNLTGQIKQFNALVNLKVLRIYTENMEGNFLNLNPSLEEFVTKSIIYGASHEMPVNLKVFKLLKNGSRVWGNLSDLPSTLIELEVYQSSFVGIIADLPSNLTLLNLHDNIGNVGGNIGALPITMIYFRYLGINVITGSIETLPNLLEFIYIAGQNTINGLLDGIPSNLTSFTIQGNNTISGTINNLPTNLKTLNIGGNNTISGNISNLDYTIESVIILGLNTITGLIESTSIKHLTIWGNNTISGNLSSVPVVNNSQNISIRGNNTIKNSTVKNYTGITTFNITIDPVHSSFISSQIDQMLIDLAVVPNIKAFINLQGINAVRTSASDNAVATLLTNGGTLILP